MLSRTAFAPRKKNSRRAQERRSFPSHLAWLRKRPCMIEGRERHVCGGRMEVHHIREGESSGMGLKCFDYEAVPLCSEAHMEGHNKGWPTFEAKYRIKLDEAARAYAKASPHRYLWEGQDA